MAVLLPALISIGTGAFGAAAGAIAAGTAGFAAYATVAGTLLTGLGALTGKKDLLKLGGILSLGAGIAGMAGGAGQAAASGTSELAADAGAAASNGADLGFMADGSKSIATGASNTFDAAGAVKDFGGQINTGMEVGQSAPSLGSATGAAAGDGAGTIFGKAQGIAGVVDPAGAMTAAQPQSIMGNALAGQTGQTAIGAFDPSGVASKLQQAASGVTQNDIGAYLQKAWEKTQNGLSGVGDFMRNNKEAVQIGGMALNSAYGPQAEALDYQKSIMERARRNRNSPVKLNFGGA